MDQFRGLKPFIVSGSCAAAGANVIAALAAPGAGKEYVLFDISITSTDTTGNTATLVFGAANQWIFTFPAGALKETLNPRIPIRAGDNKAISLNLTAAKAITYNFLVAVDATQV